MRRTLKWLAAVVTTFLTLSSAYAAPTAREKIASMQYLVGTWSCAHTVGTFSGTYKTTYADALGGLWLRQTSDFPPRQFGEKGDAVRAEFLMGYDERRQAWVRFGVLSTGQYFAIRMTDAGDGGWSWKYVSFFKRSTPETADSDATFTKKSASEYVVDGPSYEEDGKLVREHHVCKKM
ncbi:MAG TPA: hypothetical protein VHB47_26355 [Thermoanaerobaculia bacterium]|jgi:hypothetical protein|nr:hypothetical protein [Thermoanaerobaculia bacterium]